MNATEGIRMLIIDNNSEKTTYFLKVIKETSLIIKSCRVADTVLHAKKILRLKKTDLIFLRNSTNEEDCISKINLLRSFNQTVPIVILTSRKAEPVAFKMMENGAQDFVADHTNDHVQIEKTILYAIKNKNTAEALKLSNERYELVSKATNDMVWDWDLLNNKVFRSADGWDKVFGKSTNGESTLADSWWDRMHPDDKDGVNNIVENIIKDKELQYFEIECKMLRNDGTYANVIDRGYVVRNENGEVIRLIGATHDVTEKKIAEEQLTRLSIIAKETINAVAITNADGNIQWINESFEKITGRDAGEITGKDFSTFFSFAGTAEQDVKFMRNKMNAKKAFELDIFINTKDNKKRWLKLQCQPQFADGKKSFFSIITDITQAKESEEILRASEKRFRNIIEKSSEGMSLVNEAGIIMEMSLAGKKILGYAENDDVGTTDANVVYPEDADKVNAVFADVISTPGSVKNAEYRFRMQNGEFIWLESAFHNLLQEPEIGAVVIHFRDISQRKYFEQVLRNSEENYRNLFNNNPSAIFIWNPANHRIIEMNDAAKNEYGYSKEQFQVVGMNGLYMPHDISKLNSTSAKMLAKDYYKESVTLIHRTGTGTKKLMEINCRAIDYYGSKACLSIINNITEKADLEQKLQNERRERQNEITDAVITAQEQEREELGKELHDNINQILATTKLYIEHALTNVDKRTTLLQSAKSLVETAVGEIRSLSKSLMPPSLGEVGLIMALNELIESLQPVSNFLIIKDWAIKDENKLSERLRLTIFRIIQEQLTNISKHANAKKVWITLKEKKEEFTITVKDNGEGFDTKQKRRGVGLKNILSRAYLHNGKLNIDTEKGKGCVLTVAFKLPVKK
jgi:PAS domain S-box-containing protein